MVKGKIAIRKIDCSKSRQVTFFKRRTGLLKKAKELSILCDAEIGIVIFSCTGKIYDYASTSMKSVIERYNGMKKEHTQDDPVAAEIQLLQKEAQSLMQQLKCLQECHRHLMGEGISKLSFEDLRQLEKLLEMSLKNIRTKKDERYQHGLRELKQKADDVGRENKELRKRLKMVARDNDKLKMKEIYGWRRTFSNGRNQFQKSSRIVKHKGGFVQMHSSPTKPTVETLEKPPTLRPDSNV